MNEIYIDPRLVPIAERAEEELKEYFKEAERVCQFNCTKVLEAFIRNRVAYQDFEEINGYGFYDGGRDKVEKVFAEV